MTRTASENDPADKRRYSIASNSLGTNERRRPACQLSAPSKRQCRHALEVEQNLRPRKTKLEHIIAITLRAAAITDAVALTDFLAYNRVHLQGT